MSTEAAETSTAALAVTVKPALDPRVVIGVVAAGVITAGVVVGVKTWRNRKNKTENETNVVQLHPNN